MKVKSPEKCAEILMRHRDVVWNSQAKLQLIVEYFEELSDGEIEREFRDLPLLSKGISIICNEVINDLNECDVDAVKNEMKLFSPDPLKVKAHVAYLRSIGICTQTPDIELENLENPIKSAELGDV